MQFDSLELRLSFFLIPALLLQMWLVVLLAAVVCGNAYATGMCGRLKWVVGVIANVKHLVLCD
jgi:hypothetical protein